MVAGRKRTAIGWNPMEERIPKEASVVEARTAAELLVKCFFRDLSHHIKFPVSCDQFFKFDWMYF